ncbi:MAG: DMT family transporter [Opitutales bacterium]
MWSTLLPLIAAVGYAFSVMLVKRAMAHGVGTVRSLFVANLAKGLIGCCLLLFAARDIPWAQAWQPLLAALGFMGGQIFTFLAIRAGDTSVVTPIMGTKPLFVGLGSALFFRVMPDPSLWLAVVLAMIAIFLLSCGDIRSNKGTAPAVALALIASVTFGATDSMVGAWGATFSPFAFLGLLFGAVGLLSFGLIPLFREPLRAIEAAGWPWLLGGAGVMAGQALLLGTAMAVFGEATRANVLYSSRGIWSLVLVVLLGAWLQNREASAPRHILILRLAGACLLTVALALALLTP